MDDPTFLRMAMQVAKDRSASGQSGPFGAVVVREGEVVGRGWNRVVEVHDPTAHAEILAIREAARRLGTHVLDECVLYCSCEPCPMCLSAVYWARIPRIVYAASAEDAVVAGFDDAMIAAQLRREWPDRTLEARQLLREEGKGVLESWARNPDRATY